MSAAVPHTTERLPPHYSLGNWTLSANLEATEITIIPVLLSWCLWEHSVGNRFYFKPLTTLSVQCLWQFYVKMDCFSVNKFLTSLQCWLNPLQRTKLSETLCIKNDLLKMKDRMKINFYLGLLHKGPSRKTSCVVVSQPHYTSTVPAKP